ncbi:MAG: molybdopterin-dependent oxidoreductase [Pseudomonadota bacterium]
MADHRPVSTKSTCPYCGVGCGIIATRDKDGTVSIKGDPDHPANFGRLCSKGSALAETLGEDGRLLHPTIEGEQTDWDTALDLVADRFQESIQEYGPDSVAFYVSGQLLTEDYYAANKLMKGFIGSANIDTNSRLCMASSVAGHRRAFGADIVPGVYEDLELADLLVLVGSNLAWCHPVVYQRIVATKEERPHMKIVCIDPRRTMTADFADMHLPILPDGDVALFLGLLSHLDKNDALDHTYISRHVDGLDDTLEAARKISFEDVVCQTGIPVSQLSAFFELFAKTDKTVTVYSQGVNQSAVGTDKVNAIINCHLATGRIGRCGTGPFSITGQPNAMGGREVGGLANMLAAHTAIENPGHRELVQQFWQSPIIADKPGLKAVDMFREIADGSVKALWIMATNPANSIPDGDLVETALKTCPFVVVSDIVQNTDTMRHANVTLPAAGWGEKDGTVTNSERCISRQKPFLPMPGSSKPDWWIISQVARKMGFGDAFNWQSPAEIFREHAQLSGFENNGSRGFDISGSADISDEQYDGMTPCQWPLSEKTDANDQKRFFASGGFFTPSGKANAVPIEAPAQQTKSSNVNVLMLNTGRVRDHWHTMTRTGRSPKLSAHMAEPYAELHPIDADRIGVADSTIIRIRSRDKSILVRALITQRQQRGAIFVPMHWNDQFAASSRVNRLIPPVTDPISGQPASKNVPVFVEPYDAKVYGFAVTARKPSLDTCHYWALAKTGSGWRTEFALAGNLGDEIAFARLLANISRKIDPIIYLDQSAGQTRTAFFEGNRLLAAIFTANCPVAVSRETAVAQLTQSFADMRSRFHVIAGRPGADMVDPGPMICSCFNIGANQINQIIRSGQATSVEAVGKCLNAGTNCGSCRAEIRDIINATRHIAAE